jgi:hypothetical protein
MSLNPSTNDGTASDDDAVSDHKGWFCSECGTKLDDGDVFCFKCGTHVKDAATENEESTPTVSQAVCFHCGGTVEPDAERCPRCLESDPAIRRYPETSPVRTTANSAMAWYIVFSIFGFALIVAGIICLVIHGNQVATDNFNNQVNQRVANFNNQNGIDANGQCDPSSQSCVAVVTHTSSLLLLLGWIGIGVGAFVFSLVLIFAFVRYAGASGRAHPTLDSNHLFS